MPDIKAPQNREELAAALKTALESILALQALDSEDEDVQAHAADTSTYSVCFCTKVN